MEKDVDQDNMARLVADEPARSRLAQCSTLESRSAKRSMRSSHCVSSTSKTLDEKYVQVGSSLASLMKTVSVRTCTLIDL